MSSSDSDEEMLHTISDSSETENDKKHDRVYKERVDYLTNLGSYEIIIEISTR